MPEGIVLINFQQFDLGLQRFKVERVRKVAEGALRRLATSIFVKIVKRTPIDTGRAIGSWQLTIGGEGADIGEEEAIGRGAAGAIAAALAELKAVSVFNAGDINITNSAPYILILEDGGFVPPDPGPSKDPRPERFGKILVRGGYSVQAPAGMVKITIAEAVAGVL